ncbi:MAG: histidine kinase [Bacteroidetes bacterium]|nr:MAG: histidine kinase [Bacteroidota bacterium]
MLFLSTLLLCEGYGQPSTRKENLFITVYGPEDGLRQSMVSQVFQDHNGLIWMTTGDGLHCFDGSKFRLYRMPSNHINTHADNLMREIAYYDTSTLTISSSSSILNFNVNKGEFNIIYRKDGSFPELLKTRDNNKPLAWLPGQKLFRVEKGSVIPLNLAFSNNNEPPSGFSPISSVRHNQAELLISGEQGIISIRQDDKNKNNTLRAQWIPLKDCQDLAKDRMGRTFILTSGRIKQYLGNGKTADFHDTRIAESMHMFIDSRDNIWLSGKNNHRLFRLTGGVLSEIKFQMISGKHIDSISPNIKCIYEDNHGNLWFGTDGDGVMVYSPDQIYFDRASIGFTRCLTWYNNSVWAGTYNNGLWKLSSDLSRYERILPDRLLDNIYFLDFGTDKAGRLWIAARSGIVVLSPYGDIIFSYKYKCSSAGFLKINRDTISIVCDNRLLRFNSGKEISFINSTAFVQVSSFLIAGDSYWVGNPFGLYKAPKEPGVDKIVPVLSSNRLLYSQVYCLLLHDGNIWAGTGNGIELFSQSGEPLPKKAGIRELRDEVIYAMFADHQGRVWFTCNQGIGCISSRDDEVVFFTVRNNLQSLEFNYNAACQSPDGKIFFGGIKGVNGFEPSRFHQKKESPEVRMLELFAGDSSITRGIPPRYTKINLNRKAPHLSGKVYSTDVINAGDGLYSFFLEGYQQTWSKPSVFSEFSYRDLPPGEYRLMAKCADAWHNWSEPVLLLSVSLKPPYWKTRWFLVILVAVIITSTALIVKRINSLRFRRKIKELEQQHAIEKERLRISKDMHDEVGASLTRISILSELARRRNIEPGQSLKVIAQISEIAGNVVDEMSEIIWAMNPRNDRLDSFAAYIRQYASTYLETAEIQVAFDFPDDVPALPMSSEMRRNLFLTIKEALHNVVKHSGADSVRLKLRTDKNSVFISIKDTGAGFDTGSLKTSGNGLHNMRRRVEDCGGKYRLNSEPGMGTLIELTLTLS